MKNYDVIIVGGACAGLTAALYSARRELKTLVLTKDLGGQLGTTTEVENYPGYESIMGPELVQKFNAQATKAGAEIVSAAVSAIRQEGEKYVVTANEEFIAPVVILAFGLQQRKLGAPGEKELTGRGVAYCATCDGPFFRNKRVAVVGGGNSAFESAEYLSNLASEVHLINRTDKYRAEDVLIETVTKAKNITIHNFTEISEFVGEQRLEKIKLINNQTNEESELELDGVFIEIGWVSQIGSVEGLKDIIKVDERDYVIVDNQSRTSAPGIFAAGDVTDTPFKQAVISAGEGAKAAMGAAVYLQKLKGNTETINFNKKN